MRAFARRIRRLIASSSAASFVLPASAALGTSRGYSFTAPSALLVIRATARASMIAVVQASGVVAVVRVDPHPVRIRPDTNSAASGRP